MLKSIAVVAVVALVGCGEGKGGESSASAGLKSSQRDRAKLVVQQFAFEAFPQWAVANPRKECPDKLEDLAAYMINNDTKDPWGTPYKLLCGRSLPAGVRGAAVMSAGEDQKEGTDDDVRSWD